MPRAPLGRMWFSLCQLQLLFLTLTIASPSKLLLEQLQAINSFFTIAGTKMVRSKVAANGQLGRGRNEGVFRLSGSLWLTWCYGQVFLFIYSYLSANYQHRFLTAKPFLSFSMEVKNPLSISTKKMLIVTNQRYRCPACYKLELLKSAISVYIPFKMQI